MAAFARCAHCKAPWSENPVGPACDCAPWPEVVREDGSLIQLVAREDSGPVTKLTVLTDFGIRDYVVPLPPALGF